MLDFGLTPAEREWRAAARGFVKEHILPRTDLDTHGHFPRDLYQSAFDAGFVTAMIPRDLGGGEKSVSDMVLAAEEFGYGDLGVATSTFLLTLATGGILHFGTDSQKQRWIVPLTEELRFASHAWTEPEGSSNLIGQPAATVARPVDGGFVLNGAKSTISNANVSSMFCVFARVEPGPAGLSCFIVPRNAKGVETRNPYKKMGQRAADTGELLLHDVFVPSQDLLGRTGEGVVIAMRAMRASRIGIAAMAVGVARRARDLVIQYGHARTAGDGRRLIEQQDYRFRVAEFEAEIEMIRALVWVRRSSFPTVQNPPSSRPARSSRAETWPCE
jgi:alkylation response protein AidB-like acyl-CoA dehydrogenase